MKLIKSSVATLSLLASPVSAFATNHSVTLPNQTGVTSLPDLFNTVFTFLLGIVGGLAIIFLIIGGIRYILARGDEKAAKGAKDQITAAIIGLVVALLAVVIVSIVGTILGTGGLNKPGETPTTIKK